MIKDFPIFPERASTFAWQVDSLYFLLVGLTLFFSVSIFATIIFFVIKYRRRSPDEQPRQIHGSLPLELIWSIIPLFMVVGMFALGADVYFRMSRTPSDPLDIYVVGKQWMWKIQHPEGKREINELHVPLGQPVRLTMTSEDVIHSFFVPAFRVKKDVVPGRYNTLWFEATKTGEFPLYCAEYCGTQHSGMIGTIVVMEPGDYQNWLMGGATGGESMSQAGERQFQLLGCQTCHKAASTGRGPSLVGVFGKSIEMENGATIVADEPYLRESILNPMAKVVAGYKPIMNPYQGQISETTLLQLISHIKSLSAEDK